MRDPSLLGNKFSQLYFDLIREGPILPRRMGLFTGSLSLKDTVYGVEDDGRPVERV